MRLICSSWYRLVFQYLIIFCRYHRQLRYLTWQRHRCVLRVSEWIRYCYMVQRQQLRFKVMDIRWILTWIFYRNRLKVFPIRGILILIQFLLRQRWRSWILKVQYSYQLIFWFCLSINRRFLFRWYNVLLRSCWLHLLFRWSIILGGIIICRYRFWLHRRQLVLNLRKLLLGRVFLLQFLRKRYWKHHLLLR